MPLEVLKTRDALRHRLREIRRQGKSVGLVPTMGALHAGHLSLVDAARRECDFCLATIFVNPTQFGPHEDFSRYPRTLEADLEMLAERGTSCVFAPATEEMYRPGDVTFVEVPGVSEPLEGKFRPGHFRGVATVVLKLFNLALPDVACFGRKDYQQSLVVRRMVADLELPIEVRVCPTVREPDGLAMSSRNRYLAPADRQRALAISRSLRLAAELAQAGTREAATLVGRMREVLLDGDLLIDYVTLCDPETLAEVERLERPAVALVAARLGNVRLIDNETIGS
jgi:pantoate--beta-alanine ligase